MKKWTIEDARELYNIAGWGTSYFGINEKGNVYVTPCKDQTQIDLREVMDELALRDVTPPVLLRFPDILDNRIEKTWSCFNKAAKDYDYIEGGVANDRVVDTVNLYMQGLMTLDIALARLSEHRPNNQMCLLNQQLTDKYLIFDGTESIQ